MRFLIWRFIVHGLWMLCIISGPRGAMADEALAKRFLEEAPRKWHEYKSLLRGFERQSEYLTELISDKNEEITADRVVFGADGIRAVLESKPKKAKKQEIINGTNPDYSFELRKTPMTSGAFSIHNVTPRALEGEGVALRIAARRAALIWQAHPLDFLKVISSSSFHVRDAKQIVQNGSSFVQIAFEYHLSNPGPNEQLLAKHYAGTILLAPDCFWAIVELKMQLDDDPLKEVGAIELENQITNSFRGLPVIMERRVRWYSPTGTLLKRVTEKNKWNEFTGSNESFTLSAYGFPEPSIPHSSKMRLWLFCLSVILLVVCVALLVYRHYRRWQRA